jgi:hypothetical protein
MGWMNSEDGSRRYGPLTKREISAVKDDLEGRYGNLEQKVS